MAALVTAMSPNTTTPTPPELLTPVDQSAQPDSYGYKWIDNQGADDPAAGGAGPDFDALWTNIASSGTQLTALNCDDCTTTLSLPIMIRYYGQNWGTAPAGSGAQVVSSTMVVSSNGNTQFLNSGQFASASYTNSQLPANGMNGMVAHFWDDGYGSGGGNCRWEVVGSAPNRRLIIQYTGWDFCCSDGTNMEFQIQFTESDGTADSTITFLYNDITPGVAREEGNSATIGIQSPTQNSALSYSYNQAVVSSGHAIRFYTNQNPDAPTNLNQAAEAGGSIEPVGFVSDSTVSFRGMGTDPDVANLVGIQVEILPATQSFDPTAVTGELAQTAPGSLVAQGQVAEATYDFLTGPYASGDYHWRARTIDNAGGTSGWVVYNPSSAVHFTVDLQPPSAPIGPFTPDEGNSVGVQPPGSDVLFRWGPAIDVGPPGPLQYRLQVSASPGFGAPLADETISGQEFQVVLNISSVPYFWRVAAIDQAGNQGPFTPPISFIVKFNDSINHGGGDCNISAGVAPGPMMPALLTAVLLAYGLRRRRR